MAGAPGHLGSRLVAREHSLPQRVALPAALHALRLDQVGCACSRAAVTLVQLGSEEWLRPSPDQPGAPAQYPPSDAIQEALGAGRAECRTTCDAYRWVNFWSQYLRGLMTQAEWKNRLWDLPVVPYLEQQALARN